MKRNHDSNPGDWEKDPVWNLLRQAPAAQARPTFADDVLRAARLQEADEPWWKRFRLQLALGSLGTAVTAAVVAMVILQQSPNGRSDLDIVEVQPPAEPTLESLESLDEIVRTEALLVAAEDPSAFSDAELVSLISY